MSQYCYLTHGIRRILSSPEKSSEDKQRSLLKKLVCYLTTKRR